MSEFIRSILHNPWAVHLVNAAILFFASILFGTVLRRFLNSAGRTLIAKTETEFDDLILDVLLPRIKWIAIVVGLYLASEELGKNVINNETGRQFLKYLDGIIYVAFISIISALIIRLTDVSVQFGIEQHAKRTSSKINDALLPLLHRLVLITIVLIASITALGHFGVDVSSLLVFLGGSSVAIALAAQDTLQNMIAGFVIMLDRPFRIGDRIKLPTGEIGDVHEIGLRSTKVLDFDNNLIISPNAELVKTKIINFSYPQNEIRVLVDVGVAYGTNLDEIRAMILGFAERHSEILKSPAPEVYCTALGESACQLQLIARTDDWKKKFRAETQIREQVYKAMLEHGIHPGHPQRVVHLRQANAHS
jgi:MscS family membrane protein